jgi:hypothetical protein
LLEFIIGEVEAIADADKGVLDARGRDLGPIDVALKLGDVDAINGLAIGADGERAVLLAHVAGRGARSDGDHRVEKLLHCANSNARSASLPSLIWSGKSEASFSI